jgi:hypothetical protein
MRLNTLVRAVVGVSLLASGRSLLAQSSASGNDPFTRVAPAVAAAEAARAHLRTTESELADLVRNQRYVFENSRPYLDAVAEQQAAYAKYTAARKEAIAALDLDPEYVEGKKIRDDLAFKISQEHASRHPDRVQIDALTQYRLRINEKLSAREAEQITSTPAVGEARQELAAATSRLDELKRDFDIKLRTSAELAVARKNWRTAVENADASLAFADATVQTANVLIDYAYFSQWISTYRPVVINGGYAYPGYGGWTPYTAVSPTNNTGTAGGGYGMMPGQ